MFVLQACVRGTFLSEVELKLLLEKQQVPDLLARIDTGYDREASNVSGGRFNKDQLARSSERRERLGGGGGHRANAQRLFEGRYTIPINGNYRDNGGYTFTFSDWVGPGMTNVYRIGGVASPWGSPNATQMLARCSEGGGWQG